MFNARVVELSTEEQVRKRFRDIGVYPEGVSIMTPKALHALIRLEGVGVKEAHILKQEMLSAGGEAAVAKGAVALTRKETDVLLMGTVKQLERATRKLSMQPFECPRIAEEIEETLENYSKGAFTLKAGGRQLRIDRPLVMGVINVTPDSFSDGGEFLDAEVAIAHAKKLVKEGADILDIGGESSRPGSDTLSAKEELERIVPVLEGIIDDANVLISVDTCKPRVASKVLDMGAHIINDITGLTRAELAGVVARHEAGIVIMHMQGTPKTMQKSPRYDDVVADILRFLRERIKRAEKKGIRRESIIIDPGIGFGKTAEHNLEIISRLKEFKSLGLPVLVGASRKSFIGKVLDKDVDGRLSGGLAMLSMSIQNGASIVRAHDVRESADAARMTWAALNSTR
ncbi:MAG: dihydropteroate synthase [Candidatus Thermoplasmatota archaeon]|nr:dihydropteroate synthase [Candidatus Thermoplasmatota archaeon]